MAVLENSQAVTAYALPHAGESLFAAGADLLICGEAYWNWDEIQACLIARSAPPGNCLSRHHPAPSQIVHRLVSAPSARYHIPAWDLFAVEGYWRLPYAHGPKTGRFLPILTSRGCPYPCDFCVVPETNRRKWRARAVADVVAEMIELKQQTGVSDFQIEDLNPTVNSSRWKDLSEQLLAKSADIRYYIVSGTKAETLRLDDIPLYALSGCRYISISPESGSKAVMDSIGKPFDYDHGLKVIELCHEHGIRTQACFIVGHPVETDADHCLSLAYLRRLVRAGLDEAAIFIVAPIAGSRLQREARIELTDKDALLSFTPKGRSNWIILGQRRRELIRTFSSASSSRAPVYGCSSSDPSPVGPRPRWRIYSAAYSLCCGTHTVQDSVTPMSEPAIQAARVLVVIPCYNEGKSIRGVLEQICALDERVDTLVVDDGSQDDTSEQARPLSCCVRLVMNLGIGGAVQTGYRYARENNYDLCIQLDGDGQHPPDQIPVLLAAVRATGANMVIGSRFLSTQGFRSTRVRRIGIRLISATCRRLFGLKVTDPTSGFRLCDRRAISLFAEQYPQDFPEPVSIGYALAAGLKIGEVPVRMIERIHGSSSITGLKNLAYMIRVLGNLVLVRLDFNP